MRKIKNIDQLMEKYYSYKITRGELRTLLKCEPFGRVTGIIGPFVLRYHKNKLIISDRAIVYNASQSRESVENRNSFASRIKFARALYQIEALKKIWQKSDTEGTSTYHKILKQNKFKDRQPTLAKNITPRGCHFITENHCSLNDQMNIVYNKDYLLRPDETLVIVIVPFDPLNVKDSAIEVFSNSISSPQSGNEIKLCEEQLQLLRRYKKYIIYSVTIRENDGNVEWSNTAADPGVITQNETIITTVIILSFAALYLRIKKNLLKKVMYNEISLFDG